MNDITILSITASMGLGAVTTALLIYIYTKFENRLARFRAFIPKRVEVQKKAAKKEDRKTILFMGGGALLLGLVLTGTPYMLSGLLLGAGLGFIAKKIVEQISTNSEEIEKVKQVALLYESVDLYLKANFTVKQALQLSTVLVPGLKDAVNKCLNRWPLGPLKAIEQMGEDIGVKEADMLVSLLMHAEESGVEKVSGIMAQEALRLEELRKSLAESRVATRPVYSTVYMLLPVASLLGIIVAPLAYRAIQMITGLQAGGGL